MISSNVNVIKVLYCLLLFNLLSFDMPAQSKMVVLNPPVSVELEGVYASRYKRNEINKWVLLFDNFEKERYFSVKINNEIVVNQVENIITNLCTSFLFPNQEVFMFVNDSDSYTSYIPNGEFNNKIARRWDCFYTFVNDTSYIYKIIHFKAKAVRLTILNDLLDINRRKNSLNLDYSCIFSDKAYDISPAVPFFYNYLIYSYEILDLGFEDEKLRKWELPDNINIKESSGS